MNGVLARVRDFYVAPGSVRGAPGGRAAAPAAMAAVLGPPHESAVAAAALALALARAGGSPCALAAFWGTRPAAPRLPAYPSARRLAARLASRGVEAESSLRLVRVPLPRPSAAAVATAQRAGGVAQAPVALALAGPREPEIDELLRRQDVIVLACRPDEDPALACMARESLSGLAAPVVTCQVGTGLSSRALTLAGVGSAGGLRGALWPALEAAR
ncbi:MAG: hypothetical protein ACJ76S_00675 [Solirubrobacteraceae bacterium]